MSCTHRNYLLPSKKFLIISIALSVLSGCNPIHGINLGGGLTDEIYQKEPVYEGPIDSIGTLTQGYIQNTESLIIVNGRLDTICIAYKICEDKEK